MEKRYEIKANKLSKVIEYEDKLKRRWEGYVERWRRYGGVLRR